MPFTLNFTVTSLRYTEDMQPPGSLKFNTTEKSLQRQVRAPPTSSSSCILMPAPPTPAPSARS